MAAFLRLHGAEYLLLQWKLPTERLRDANQDAWIPVLFVSEHGPGEDCNFASQRDCGFLLARLLFAVDPIVNGFRPRVVAKRRPSAFGKDRSGQRIASLGDSTITIGFPGLELARYQTEVCRDLSSILKTMWIVNTGYEDLGGTRANARDRLKPHNARIFLAQFFKLLDDIIELLSQSIKLREFDIEFSFPEFVGCALGEWFAKRVDSLTTGVPSFLTGIDGDAMVDEPSSDGAFHLVDALVERFPILDE